MRRNEGLQKYDLQKYGSKKYVMRVTYFNEKIWCVMGEMIVDGNTVRTGRDYGGNKLVLILNSSLINIKLAGTDGSLIKKPRADWSDDDKKKVGYKTKAKNIITSALSADEFFKVSNSKTAKEMWDTLQETHEGTTDVKRARTNTLMHEYELVNMKKDESINDLQTREWQPKVTAIAESKDLGSMTIATLFGKLREHEMELHRWNESEEIDRKRKGLSLKAQTHKVKSEPETCADDSERETDEEPEIGINKFVKAKGKDEPSSKTKRSYIVWNDNDEESSENSEDEEAKLCLMANVDSDSESDVCLTSKTHSWYLDSGYSKHMTGDKSKFISLNLKDSGYVKYDDNNKGKILGAGDIGSESTTVIKDVLYVKGLKHNLLSLSQLCDKGYQVYFTSHTCTLEHKEDDSLKLVGERVNNIYMIDLDSLPANNV
ncbi:uncharacterized protein [Cicer arietinum]|uniref:uncharacterized protein n=1 Tax=Cicer arietinum TaxID=3827 RepID=UPI003CC6798E